MNLETWNRSSATCKSPVLWLIDCSFLWKYRSKLCSIYSSVHSLPIFYWNYDFVCTKATSKRVFVSPVSCWKIIRNIHLGLYDKWLWKIYWHLSFIECFGQNRKVYEKILQHWEWRRMYRIGCEVGYGYIELLNKHY